MSKKQSCIINGKTIVINDDYYQKKVREFGSEDDLTQRYTCRQAKNLLVRGYSVEEIRTLLKVDKKMSTVSEEIIKMIRQENSEDSVVLDTVSIKKSDPEVAAFIANIRNLNP
jgi:predicted CopG family antitoxin